MHEQFERVVEAGGVASAGGDDWGELGDVVAKVRRGKHGFAGVHPVDVAPQGVDLTVVDDVAVGVRQFPFTQRVGAEAGMDHGECADDAFVVQIMEEIGHLVAGDHAFVDDHAGG